MSAQTQPPSEKITKLKLFLEKSKTDFTRENPELISWSDDRGLKIEELGQASLIQEKISQIPLNSVQSEVINKFNQVKKNTPQLESEISLEEYNAIFEKLVDLLTLPAGELEDQSELYLEQQLGDLLGFDVVAELDNQRLTHSTGFMNAEPHLKRYPNDELKNHANAPEAGIAQVRSAFGWFTNHGEITPEIEKLEKYYFSLQLYHLESWSEHYKELKSWYKFRKMIVINPADRIAVVGVVGNIDHRSQLKKQFGCSPEIIREGMIWSPNSQGKVLMMFVDDPKNEVPLGPIYFENIFKGNQYE